MSYLSDPDRLERLAHYVGDDNTTPPELAAALNDAAERIRSNQATIARLRVQRSEATPPEVSYERPLDEAETAVYRELRRLDCAFAVDPDDAEDCAFAAIHAVAALRASGHLTAGVRSEAEQAPCENCAQMESDLLYAMQVRHEVLQIAAAEVLPGPDGQDYLDRERLIEGWVNRAHEDVAEIPPTSARSEAEQTVIDTAMAWFDAGPYNVESAEALIDACDRLAAVGAVSPTTEWVPTDPADGGRQPFVAAPATPLEPSQRRYVHGNLVNGEWVSGTDQESGHPGPTVRRQDGSLVHDLVADPDELDQESGQ